MEITEWPSMCETPLLLQNFMYLTENNGDVHIHNTPGLVYNESHLLAGW